MKALLIFKKSSKAGSGFYILFAAVVVGLAGEYQQAEAAVSSGA